MGNFEARLLRADFRNTRQVSGAVITSTVVDDNHVASIHDIAMAHNSVISLEFNDSNAMLVIPLFGGVDINGSENDFLGIGHFRIISKTQNGPLTLSNPYDGHTVQLLVIEFSTKLLPQAGAITFDARNTLLPITASQSILTGVFDLRSAGEYTPQHKTTHLLAYVIGGAFEFEDRLLEFRDTLLLYNTAKVEFEALSQDAIVLVLDFGRAEH